MGPETKAGKLFLFTVDFPYGNFESSFLPQELDVLSKAFESIFIVPLQVAEKEVSFALPANTKTLNISSQPVNTSRLFDYIRVTRFLLKEFLLSFNLRLISNLKYHLNESLIYLELSKKIDLFLKENKYRSEDILFYSYWFDSWTTALTFLRRKKLKNIKIVSRAHGFDLYENRNEKGYIFPRHLQIKNTYSVYSISKNGEQYLKAKFPSAKNKIHYSPLGVNQNKKVLAGPKTNETIVIVSCSSVIKLKRVHKIIDILKHIKKEVHWVHFGAGELFHDLTEKTKTLPPNIKVDLLGHVDNDLVKQFYSQTYVDWFINVSEYEGIPVSMMEAISFGIPLIGTDVGGVNEIVNEQTGFLIEKDFNPANVKELIENQVFTKEQRTAILNFWKKNYNAELNFKEFANSLKN